ncbi:MAG: hypothetical protein ABI790_15545 [Betaproteobacteria bacterium]
MQNMKPLAIFAGVALLVGLVALVMATHPLVALFGKLAIAIAAMGFAAFATVYLMGQSVAALAIRNEDFHWH